MKKNNSYILRPIKKSDSQSLHELSKEARGGLSNLPKTREAAKKLAEKSTLSFQNKCPQKEKKFIFVIETNQKEIVGISGIKTRVGIERPYYSFLINNTEKHPHLELIQQYLGPSEIGSLFLSPKHRNKGIGRLLSLSRFLFIRCFKEHFTNIIIAELRGFLYKNNVSPFWNNLGKKFIPLSFNKADIESVKNKAFIRDNFPKKPIYLNLLNPIILPYLSAVHPFTEPAKKLLLTENFNVTNHIDIFDGGPKLESLCDNIRTIKESKKTHYKKILSHVNNNTLLVCNQQFETFRCMRVTKHTPLNQIKQQLNIKESDPIIYVKERS